MSDSAEKTQKEVKFNQDNLYREETITDLSVGSIRMLTPIKIDGTVDANRTPLFIGQAQLMSPDGPMPIQCPIDAKSLTEAMEKFPESMEWMMKQIIS